MDNYLNSFVPIGNHNIYIILINLLTNLISLISVIIILVAVIIILCHIIIKLKTLKTMKVRIGLLALCK